MYAAYREIAPRVEDWPVLVRQLTGLLKVDSVPVTGRRTQPST